MFILFVDMISFYAIFLTGVIGMLRLTFFVKGYGVARNITAEDYPVLES